MRQLKLELAVEVDETFNLNELIDLISLVTDELVGTSSESTVKMSIASVPINKLNNKED